MQVDIMDALNINNLPVHSPQFFVKKIMERKNKTIHYRRTCLISFFFGVISYNS